MEKHLSEQGPAPINPADLPKADALINALKLDKKAAADFIRFYKTQRAAGKTNKKVDAVISQVTGGKLAEGGEAGFADPTVAFYGTIILSMLPAALGLGAAIDWYNNWKKNKSKNQTPTTESTTLAEGKQGLNESIIRLQKLANIK